MGLHDQECGGMLKLSKKDYFPHQSDQEMARGQSSYLELKLDLLKA